MIELGNTTMVRDCKGRWREVIYWDLYCDDRLNFEDRDEAIRDYLEYIELVIENIDGMPFVLPETIEVFGYARRRISTNCWIPLEAVLEHLDEEYGDPDGGWTEPTEAMSKAEDAFIRVVCDEYEPWSCEEVWSEQVNVLEWIKEHEPEWLEEGA